MGKSTLKDVALEAGVGTATVERVINGRGGVSYETAERVLRAAKKLKYGLRPAERLRGTIRIEVILTRPESEFFSRLAKAFERIAASLDRSIVVHRTFVAENDPAALALYIENPSFRRSGLVIVSTRDRRVEASLAKVRASGVEVVQVVTRCADPDIPYVGIDNYAAGRSAAFYLSRMLASVEGSLVALCHSGAYDVHRSRMQGFSDYLAEHPDPSHDFPVVMLGLDDERRSEDLLYETLSKRKGIIGLYTAGGNNAVAAAVLKGCKLAGRVFWIGHELDDHTRALLKDGTMTVVLDQAPEVQARRSLDIVMKRLGLIEVEVSEEPVRFFTVTRESV
ncbi:LacI family transcriptional regulator [Aureimonas endophytica]|uniref:LacI family transcriptional regulator n=1 Tax=Aureimonas endophytica TaxID=2027858 RepID=A0A916ZKY6_9HYPH|nr:LacI family DNA-binding transcriptional regulator [Aureimonas endophytica]GGE02783.1 LacI family transcriptional regulator [Aureimonas endophytica]